MEALANRGKYKVIDRLESGGGYEAFTAVDIEAREHAEVLVKNSIGVAAVIVMAVIIEFFLLAPLLIRMRCS